MTAEAFIWRAKGLGFCFMAARAVRALETVIFKCDGDVVSLFFIASQYGA